MTIRPAVAADADRLVDVEIAAGAVFRTVGLHRVADDVPDVEALRRAIDDRRVWVRQVDGGVAGYVVAEVVDGNAHVAQVSVDPRFSGRRHGAALVDHVSTWGAENGCPATTLTTFSTVAWNAPSYERLGFVIITGDDVGPELAAVMAAEARLPGLDEAPRCAMRRPN